MTDAITQIDTIIHNNGGELIAVLQEIQELFGYLPENAISHIAEKLDISSSHIYGVATFYRRFRLKPCGEHLVKICTGTACHVAGAQNLKTKISDSLNVVEGETTEDKKYTLETVACVGCCSLAPVMVIDNDTYGRLDPEKAWDITKNYQRKAEAAQIETGTNDSDIIIQIGMGTCGISAGAREIYQALCRELIKYDKQVNIKFAGCRGDCFREPVICIETTKNKATYSNVTEKMVPKLIEQHVQNDTPVKEFIAEQNDFDRDQQRFILNLCGTVDPESIEDYIAYNGYRALPKVIRQMTPQQVIEKIKKSGLRGRGGAGFGTGLKWSKVQGANERYLICNADEGDPGAFMDRNLLESNPHAVLEGMIIAAYAIGTSQGFFYVREEYPLAIKRIEKALTQARSKGYLGSHIAGSTFSFDISIKKGAGAFVCGEETAMIESLENKRGIPKIRPPYPVESGLYGKPTLINNVETLANVPLIITEGAESFAARGTEKSKGTKIFSLTGNVRRGGMVEVAMGTTIRHIVYKIGGGSERPIKAVQIGGPSGGCLPEKFFDTAIDYEKLQELGSIMGSGGLVAIDDSTCMVDLAKYFLKFAADESCGKCTCCRLGTRRMYEILDRITTGKGEKQDLEYLEQLASQTKYASLCGLGKSAPNPVLSTLRYFRQEYLEHIVEKKCHALKCKALFHYRIKKSNCEGCTLCAHFCPSGAITTYEDNFAMRIDSEQCTRCDKCFQVCHFKSISVLPGTGGITDDKN